jgi:DNA modification methylase
MTEVVEEAKEAEGEPTVKQFELVDVDLETIELDPTNPNIMTKEQMTAMRKSMQQYGYLSPVILDRNNKICDGEHRVLVYKELGLTTIPAYVIDLDSDADRKQLRQVMNKLHGEHDRAKDADELLEIMEQSQDRTLKELSQLIAQPEEHLLALIKQYRPEAEIYRPEIEKEYPLPEAPETQLTTVWQLGPHRLICGDCTDKRIMERLMEQDQVAQLNCDPPFGVRLGEKNADLNRRLGGNRIEDQYENDEIDFDYHEMFETLFQIIPFTDKNTIYIWSGDRHLHEIRAAFQQVAFRFSHYLVWVKNGFNLALSAAGYQPQAEFCLYGWKNHNHFCGPVSNRSTILKYDRPARMDLDHPAMKPVELIEQTITDGSNGGDIILDTFAGSGTSLIASQRTGRVWRGIELDPRYCDTIVKRWEDYTGQKAEKVPPS